MLTSGPVTWKGISSADIILSNYLKVCGTRRTIRQLKRHYIIDTLLSREQNFFF